MRYALLALAFVTSISTPAQAQSSGLYACDEDADCFHTGCSGQVCASVDVITTCEFTCEYGCYQAASCECSGRRCGFQQDAALHACVQACRQSSGPADPESVNPMEGSFTEAAIEFAPPLLPTESLEVCR